MRSKILSLSLVFSLVYVSQAQSEVPVERRGIEVDVPRNSAITIPSRQRASTQSTVNKTHQPTVNQTAEPNRLWELFNEMEVLRQENLELRGILESQANQISQLKERQKQHYIDLDVRLRELSGNSSQMNLSSPRVIGKGSEKSLQQAAGTTPLATTSVASNTPTSGSSTPPTPVAPENDLYQAALDSIKGKNYQEAEKQLKALIGNYPSGFYVLYAHYWLGEVILALPSPDLKQALSHFKRVIETDSKHKKASPSYYKLGTLQDALGQPKAAQETLGKLIARFPNSGEARLAKKYLAEMQAR